MTFLDLVNTFAIRALDDVPYAVIGFAQKRCWPDTVIVIFFLEAPTEDQIHRLDDVLESWMPFTMRADYRWTRCGHTDCRTNVEMARACHARGESVE